LIISDISKILLILLFFGHCLLEIIGRVINVPELKTLEWWISGLMHDPLFLTISRLTERTEIFSLEKTINGYPRREKKSGLGQK